MDDLKNLKIDAALHRQIKQAALDDNVTIQEWTETALRCALEQRPKVRTKLKQNHQKGTSKS